MMNIEVSDYGRRFCVDHFGTVKVPGSEGPAPVATTCLMRIAIHIQSPTAEPDVANPGSPLWQPSSDSSCL